MTPTQSSGRAQQGLYFLVPLRTFGEKKGGPKEIVRGLYFHAANTREARELVAEHTEFGKKTRDLSRKTLMDKDPNSPQHLKNDQVVHYFANGRPGSYVFFHTHGNILEAENKTLLTAIPSGWKQVPNPVGRAINGEFVPYAEQNLRTQEELMRSTRALAAANKKSETFQRKDGQIVVLDKATPYSKANQIQGYLLRTRITEPGIGKNFGTPAVFFVHRDDLNFRPNGQKPGTVVELPEKALKVLTRTVRLARHERELIDNYLKARKDHPAK